MAEIKLERKSSGTKWLWVLLALLLVLLLLWWMWPGEEPAVVGTTEVEEAEPAREPVAERATPLETADRVRIPVATIAESPGEWIGRTVSGSVQVAEVPTDRGFWVEDGGERLFAVIVDEPREVPVDINAGQTLDIAEARVRDAGEIEDLPGRPLDADTQQILSDQDVFLLVDESALARYEGGS